MEDQFHFSLLRVSIAQILKSCGFDKCKPSTLNVVTDLYVHYFNKLVQEALTCAQLRTRSNEVQLQDITQLLVLIGGVKLKNYLGEDPVPQTRENYDYNTKLVDLFVNWLKYSDHYRVCKQLNEVPISLLANLIEKRKLDLDDDDNDRKKQKYRERQDYYNYMKLNQEDDVDEEVTERDRLPWVNYVVEKDLKLGHDLKFLNTPLFDEYTKFQHNRKYHPLAKHNKHLQSVVASHDKLDYLVTMAEQLGEKPVVVLEELTKLLPYNLDYGQVGRDILEDGEEGRQGGEKEGVDKLEEKLEEEDNLDGEEKLDGGEKLNGGDKLNGEVQSDIIEEENTPQQPQDASPQGNVAGENDENDESNQANNPMNINSEFDPAPSPTPEVEMSEVSELTPVPLASPSP